MIKYYQKGISYIVGSASDDEKKVFARQTEKFAAR